MRIAVDMDEVLYSWERTARYLLRHEYRGLPQWIAGTLNRPFDRWNIDEQIGRDAYDWLFEEGIQLGLFRHGHVITGAMRGVRALKAAGHELVIVTHRAVGGVQDTLAWIDFHFGRELPYPWDGVEILSDMRSKTSVPWDAIIDDSPKNIDEALQVGAAGYQFAAAWNGWDGWDWAGLTKELT